MTMELSALSGLQINGLSSDEMTQFAVAVLEGLNAPVTEGNMMILVTWMMEENPVGRVDGPRFNPFNTTKLAGEIRDYRGQDLSPAEIQTKREEASLAAGMTIINDHGVMSYRDWDQGVDATVRTLRDKMGAEDVNALWQHLISEGGSNLASIAADPGVASMFETWSTGGYSGLGDPTRFTDHGEGGVLTAVTKRLGALGIATSETTSETGASDEVTAQIESLGTSEGMFFQIKEPGDAPGHLTAYQPTPDTFYYALPIFTDDPIAVGENVAVVWQIDGLPTGATASPMDRDTWDQAVSGNENWLQTGEIIPVNKVRFNDQGFFLTPDDDALPINEVIHQLVTEAFLAGTAALEDSGVQQVIARVIANPTLLEAMEYVKLQIQATDWGQSRTNLVANWQASTQAERRAMEQRVLEDSQSGLYKQFQHYTSTFDRPATTLVVGGYTLLEWAGRIARGEASHWDVGDAIKQYAGDMPGGVNNAWKIHVHDTAVAAGAYESQRDAKVQQLQEAYSKWGLDPALHSWDVQDLATQLMSNEISMVEVMDDIRATASSKFPGKPDLLSTTEYATPWVNIHNSEMESPINAAHPLGNEDLMTALTSGESPTEYRTRLRGKPEWQSSKRAKVLTADVMKNMESTFGFGGGTRRIT
jgi:hypothetical protein